jgi:hypothetical protein
MATHKIHSSILLNQNAGFITDYTPAIWKNYLAAVDKQEPNAVGWWFISLLLHGCILVPLTFLAVYSLNGPTSLFIFISLISFFTNFIGYMGSAPFHFNFTSFILSVLIHVAMVAYALLLAI